MPKNEALIVIDFSENYLCKYETEVQSVHFGASKKQITLQTGAFFYQTHSQIKCISFCITSDCRKHDAASIWVHMEPIFKLLNEYVPNLKAVYFQSDGPSTQYKNRNNFYLFLNYCNISKFKYSTWNFSTSGHGKSCADGIGEIIV